MTRLLAHSYGACQALITSWYPSRPGQLAFKLSARRILAPHAQVSAVRDTAARQACSLLTLGVSLFGLDRARCISSDGDHLQDL